MVSQAKQKEAQVVFQNVPLLHSTHCINVSLAVTQTNLIGLLQQLPVTEIVEPCLETVRVKVPPSQQTRSVRGAVQVLDAMYPYVRF